MKFKAGPTGGTHRSERVNDKQCQSKFSRSTIRKIFNLLHSQYINDEGCLKFLKSARSLGEYKCIDFILHYQNPQQLKNNLESVIGLQHGQFLEAGLIFFQIIFFKS